MGLKRVLNKGLAGAALVVLVAACSHLGEPVLEPGHRTMARPPVSMPKRAEVAVPALLGLSVDDLSRHLGPPQPLTASVQALLSQMPVPEQADSLLFFRRRTLEVLVSYDAKSRRFNDLLLLGSNEDRLMQRAGLAAETVTYLVLPVFHARHPTQLLGLRVVPLDPIKLQ